MSDAATVDFNPFANVGPNVPEDAVRDLGAEMVRSGVSVDTVNAHLTARGATPLAVDSIEIAESKLASLMRSHDFVRRFNEGDPAAASEFNLLTLRIVQGGGKLTDRAPRATDYQINIAHRYPNESPESVQSYQGELTKFATDLQFPPDLAKTFANLHLDALDIQRTMTPDGIQAYGDRQTNDLLTVLGSDAEARMKAASEVLTRVSGRKLDLSKIVASNGAQAALMLLHRAEELSRNGK